MEFLLFVALWAQDASVYTKTAVDLNGNRVIDGAQVVERRSKDEIEVTARTRSINGRETPVEKIEERVLREDASGKVIERFIRRYDQTGDALPPAKEIVEEQKQPNGGSTIQTTTYNGDVNGRLQVVQRSSTAIQKSGSTETAETVVQQPTLNGEMETVARQSVVKVKEPGGYQESSTTYRKNGGGEFYPAVKISKQHSENGAQSVDNSSEYEIGPTGDLQLHGQRVQKTVKRPDGSEGVEVDVFGPSLAGLTGSINSTRLSLQQQETIDRKRVSGNAVVETFSVRRPTISDPNTLGPLQQISRTTCKGKCDTDK